ncbi:cytochrome P450 714C2-like [Juglans microcarpa x Juglans regia]|uniref:cytochrome P450 714C2-like n=1 Tax=Juglans microcarpa x Juglans regia TaxID=2249226 RepID=UPI001B7EAAF7|nr:cytochrome P450 714C2-like [Juglans microcarpa x Juglans regia]
MEELKFDAAKIFIAVAFLAFAGLLVRLYNALVLKPDRLRSAMRKQGITGPPPTLLLGNIWEIKKALSTTVKAPAGEISVSHNYAALIFPFIEQWRKQYGDVFLFSLGNSPKIFINEPSILREITTYTSLDFGKPSEQQKEFGPLLGQGIVTSNGALWSRQSKILAPEFYMEKVKRMINLIIESTIPLLNSWKSRIETEGGTTDIHIDDDLRSFSGDVISRACFGSNYAQGEKIFLKLRALLGVMSLTGFATGIPGLRYLPTRSNREGWRLQKEVRNLILEVVKERRKASDHEKDFLQMVLEGAKNSDLTHEATEHFIIDNCKNIYLAGYETTAVSATWCLMLLASNQEWQDRVRAEVLDICPGGTPDADMLRKMKQLTMVIHESLRLYPPVPIMSREALKDMKLGDINIPKGVNIWTVLSTSHTDPEIWGPDALKFNPARFANGIKGACSHPHLYMPFGFGPRVCVGQHLAMVELKILIALLLSNFSFSLSPKYKHAPTIRMVIEPENGVDLLVKKL